MAASSHFSSSFMLFGRAKVSLYIIFFSYILVLFLDLNFLSFRIRVIDLS